MAGNRPGLWRPPGKGLPGMGFSGAKGGKGGGGLSESMSLLEEMKLKQEKREQRKRLREEVDSLMASSPQDIGRIARLRQELSFVEGFLAQADGNLSLPTHQPQPQGPLTVAEGQDTNNLYVGSLSTEWTEEMLSREFGRFGEITSIKIMYPRTDHQRLRGMNSGFVQFKTRAQAELARAKLNGKEFFGMCLRIDWGRAIQPVRNAPAIMSGTPQVVSKPALMPHIEAQKPMPMPMPITEGSAPSSSGQRKSRWNLAKTLVVKVPEDQVLKKLIDKTAEFVADEGWEFEKLLMDKEKENPRFAFMSVSKENLEDPLHVYYRWRTFSFSQGDNDRFWRTEPFQIYENGPLWQPPSCDKRVEEVPDMIQRFEMLLPSGGGNVSTSGKDNVIGGVALTPEELSSFHELIAELSLSRPSILKAMVFCLDKSMSSMDIAQKIGASITEAEGLTSPQLLARLYLLNDVLYNSHCTKPGASQYRRQFQELLCDVMERLREVCDGISPAAAAAIRERVLKLVENWSEWALFPPRFAKGLEAVLCSKPDASENVSTFVQQAQQHWQSIMDVATLERACRQRGLSVKGSRQNLLLRLCNFEAYWPPDTPQSGEPKFTKDLATNGKIEAGLDGESYDGPEETRPSLGLRVLLLPERWTQDGRPLPMPSVKKAKKETPKEPKEAREKAAKAKEEQKKEPKKPKDEPKKDLKALKAKEEKAKEKTPEEQRRERLRQVEAEVERYRQQLEKAREQPEVMQMKCDRRRMELLEAAAHQESWSERSEPEAKGKVDAEATAKGKPQDGKSGKEREEVKPPSKDGKAWDKTVEREKAKENDKESEKEKERNKDKDKEKDPKEKDKEKDRGKDREKGRESDKVDKEKSKVKDKEAAKEPKDKDERERRPKAKESEKDRKKRSRSSSGRRKRKAASPNRPKKR